MRDVSGWLLWPSAPWANPTHACMLNQQYYSAQYLTRTWRIPPSLESLYLQVSTLLHLRGLYISFESGSETTLYRSTSCSKTSQKTRRYCQWALFWGTNYHNMAGKWEILFSFCSTVDKAVGQRAPKLVRAPLATVSVCSLSVALVYCGSSLRVCDEWEPLEWSSSVVVLLVFCKLKNS